jgi:excisionase family DNA binding protein
MKSPYLTLDECSEYLRISASSLRKHVRTGRIPARKHFGKWVFRLDEVELWSQSKSVLPFQSRFQAVRERLRSLKTESTVMTSRPFEKKGAG